MGPLSESLGVRGHSCVELAWEVRRNITELLVIWILWTKVGQWFPGTRIRLTGDSWTTLLYRPITAIWTLTRSMWYSVTSCSPDPLIPTANIMKESEQFRRINLKIASTFEIFLLVNETSQHTGERRGRSINRGGYELGFRAVECTIRPVEKLNKKCQWGSEITNRI